MRERDVRRDAQLLDRLLGLERAPQAPAGAAEVRHGEQIVAERADAARRGHHEAAEDVEERRLAGAVRADQAARARLEADGHPVERRDAAEADGQVLDLDQRARSWAGVRRRPAPPIAPHSRARSRGTCAASPAGAVSSTCSTPTPKRIVSRSAGRFRLSSTAGSSFMSTPATTAPQRL